MVQVLLLTLIVAAILIGVLLVDNYEREQELISLRTGVNKNINDILEIKNKQINIEKRLEVLERKYSIERKSYGSKSNC